MVLEHRVELDPHVVEKETMSFKDESEDDDFDDGSEEEGDSSKKYKIKEDLLWK